MVGIAAAVLAIENVLGFTAGRFFYGRLLKCWFDLAAAKNKAFPVVILVTSR
jgi:lipid-A-disaccharide synthase-like uncharacterized protein